MRDDAPMAEALSTQLESLNRERERLEELLMLDANWRALRQLEAREAAGEPLQAVDGAGLKDNLVKALASNRLYAARAKLLETIELLSSDFPMRMPAVEPGSLVSRIVMLSEPAGETFRARLRMKPVETPVTNAPVAGNRQNALHVRSEDPRPRVCAMPDALQMIDGLGQRAVEQLLDGGVTRFIEIAGWTSVEVGAWRARLDGIAQGHPGAWIEQAAVLASGRQTLFSERVRRGEYATLVTPPDPEPSRPWRPATEIVATPPAHDMARHVTAEELARKLADKPDGPPPLPPRAVADLAAAARIEQVHADAAGAITKPAAAGYARPRPKLPASVAAVDSEVIVIAREDAPERPRAQSNAADRPRTLLRRLKELHKPDRFEADAYAAYRGTVEEASVTIVPPADSKSAAKPAPLPTAAGKPAAEGPRPASRFLKALTGKA